MRIVPLSRQSNGTCPQGEGERAGPGAAGATLGVAFGVAIVSSAAVLIRLAQADTHSLAIGAWRMLLASLFLAPLALGPRRAELRRLTRRDWASAALSGLLLAAHFAAWITSLALTSVAASVVLVTSYPLFVGAASALLLHERPTRRMVVALAVGCTGSAVIALGDLGRGAPHRLVGDLLALCLLYTSPSPRDS